MPINKETHLVPILASEVAKSLEKKKEGEEDDRLAAAADVKPAPSPYLHTMSPFISTPGGSRRQGSGNPSARPARNQRGSYGALESSRPRGDSIA